MPYCARCGKELAEDAKFCPYCGTPVGEEKVERRPRYWEEREACFGGRDAGPWGAISGGAFMIGLGVLWYLDWWWPGILFLLGIMIIIGGIVSYARRRR
ncbi:MAG: zinc-ribbon domain-containing protein [Candidatus Bathyarchaeia archaeon]